MSENKIKGLGLCRVSTIEQGRGTSLESQEEWIRKKASEMGVELVELIKREVSGEKFPREVIDHVLRLTKAEKISYIFVYHIDRLTRGMDLGIELIKEIKKKDIKIVTSSGIIDPNDINESFMLHINMAVSEHDQRKRREGVKRGIISRLKNGQYLFNDVRFGYAKDDKNHLTLRLECKPIVKFMFDVFNQTKKYSKTLDKVNGVMKEAVRKILVPLIRIPER